MAKLKSRIHAEGRGLVFVAGSFAPNGSSALAAASTKGVGYTVAYTSTGLYTLTFVEAYNDLVSCTLGLQLASGDDKTLQLGTYTAATASARPTLTIRCWDISAAAVADIAANANNRINFTAVFRNTGVTT